MFDELHPGESSYTWSRSSDILRKDGDPSIRNAALGKQSCIDHILISPNLLHAVKKIVNNGRKVSDHSGVVMTPDWAETDKGQGVFRCGGETHKNKQYQKIVFCSFYKSILDFVEDTTIQNNLREIISRIRSLTLQRIKIENDEELDPTVREETLFVVEENLLN